jgi:KDO2-lipid IV(A) lauroyltransferase
MKKKEMSRPWLSVLFLTLWTALRILPLPAAAALMSWIMRTFAEKLTRQQTIRENLSKAFPDMPPAKIRETGRAVAGNLGVIAAELRHIHKFRGGVARGALTFTGDEQLALAKKGPVIFVGPHQWNWEIMPLFYSEHGIRVTTIYGKLGNALMDRTILAQRRKTGANYVEKRKAVRAVMSALESGGSLAFIIDQRVKSGVPVKFFGRESLITGLPARLAIRYNCPIVPMDMERREGHSFHMMFGKPVYPPAEPDAQAEQQMMQAVAGQLEQIIRRSPETWFCSRKRWPDKA